MDINNNPVFMIGVLFGAALTHAQKHVDEEYPLVGEEERNLRITDMANLIISQVDGESSQFIKTMIKV